MGYYTSDWESGMVPARFARYTESSEGLEHKIGTVGCTRQDLMGGGAQVKFGP